jgi:DNA-binding protein YbaB
MNGEDWLAGYRDRLAALRARTDRAQDALAHAEATVTSPDGAVTVTVGPAGALQRLVLGERSTALTRVQLAAAVLAAAHAAHQEAARRAVAAVAPVLGGEDSEAVRVLRGNLGAVG